MPDCHFVGYLEEMTTEFQTFEDFWPFYLGEHSDPLNRAFHYVGTSMAIGCVSTAVVTLNPLWLVPAPIVGYAPAWIGHFIIEKNRPATFKHPLWSLRGDFRMLRKFVTGQIDAELAKHVKPKTTPRAEVERARAEA